MFSIRTVRKAIRQAAAAGIRWAKRQPSDTFKGTDYEGYKDVNDILDMAHHKMQVLVSKTDVNDDRAKLLREAFDKSKLN